MLLLIAYSHKHRRDFATDQKIRRNCFHTTPANLRFQIAGLPLSLASTHTQLLRCRLDARENGDRANPELRLPANAVLCQTFLPLETEVPRIRKAATGSSRLADGTRRPTGGFEPQAFATTEEPYKGFT